MAKRKLENKTIEVILLQSDKHLGEKFEIVRVKPVFARNILLPRNIAVLADLGNRNTYSQKMKAAEEHRKKRAIDLNELFMKIQNDNGLTITRKANKDNTLYAKVDENDIVATISSVYGIDIESHLFKLKKKLNALGTFTVPFLYKEMKKDVVVNILAEKTEKEEKVEKEAKSEAKTTEAKKPTAKKAPSKTK